MLNVANPNPEIDESYIKEMIIPKMYKRYFELSDESIYVKYKDIIPYKLSEDNVKILVNAEPMFLNYNDTTITLTKQLFLDIKKDDDITLYRNCYQEMDDNKRVFYVIEQVNDLFCCCTIFNTLQS